MTYLNRYYIRTWKWDADIDGYKPTRFKESNNKDYILSLFNKLITTKDVPQVELIDTLEEKNNGVIALLECVQGKTVKHFYKEV